MQAKNVGVVQSHARADLIHQAVPFLVAGRLCCGMGVMLRTMQGLCPEGMETCGGGVHVGSSSISNSWVRGCGLLHCRLIPTLAVCSLVEQHVGAARAVIPLCTHIVVQPSHHCAHVL